MTEIMDVETNTETKTETTESTNWMNPDGEFGEGTPEKIQTLLDKKKWTNINQLFDGYGELEKFKGMGEHLVIPESEDDVEGWDKIRTQLGWLGGADKYEFNYDGDIPISDDLLAQFKEYANKRRWSQKEFEETIMFQLDAIAAQDEAYKIAFATQKEENIKALKQRYGEANYETRVKEARIVADKLGIYQTLEAKGLASDPDIINMLDVIATRTAEGVITPQTLDTSIKTPQEELEEIKKSEPFLQKFHKDHKTTMSRFMELNQIIANAGQAKQPRI